MGQYVCHAIDSVLKQEYPNLEVIVVDDGSTDDTQERLSIFEKDERVRIIRQDNQGQTVAKNKALSHARGEFVGFCDADNSWLPGKLTSQVPALLENPEVGVVYGDIKLIDDSGNRLPGPRIRRYSGRITGQLLMDNFVTFNTALARAEAIQEVGGFDESLRMAIDYDLWLRISLAWEFLYQELPLAEYRIWSGQMSKRTGERLDFAFQMMANFFARYPDAVTSRQVKNAWAHSFTTRGNWHAREGRNSKALADYRSSLAVNPFSSRTWKSIIKFLLAPSR